MILASAALAGTLADELAAVDPAALDALEHAYDFPTQIAAWERISEVTPSGSPELRGLVASNLTRLLLRGGLDEDALRGWAAWPAEVREAALSGPDGCSYTDPSAGRFVQAVHEPAELAAELLLADPNAPEAPRWRTAVAEASGPVGEDCIQAPLAARDCLARLEQHPEDGIGLRFGADPTDWLDDCPSALGSRDWVRAVRAALVASGVPSELWADVDPNAGADPNGGPVAAALAAVDARDAELLAPIPETVWPPAPPPSPQAVALAHRAPYAPPRFATTRGTTQAPPPGVCDGGVCSADGAYRLESSSDLDPSGELPAAGLWLVHTTSAGVERSYLGIREHLPYEPLADHLLEIEDGVLLLPVRRSALVTRSITFPPVGLRFRGGSRRTLRIPLDEITRDSDRDGLTDLMERRTGLDPDRADSDGDGEPDGLDPYPNAAPSPPSDRTAAFAAGLRAFLERPDPAISIGVPGGEAVDQRRQTPAFTLLLEADPADLDGSWVGGRVIAIPPDGPPDPVTFPASVSLQLAPGAAFGVFSYDLGWRWGKFLVYRSGDRWVAAPLEEAVT